MAEAQELALRKGTKKISKKSSHKNSWSDWDESENPTQEQTLSKTLEAWSQTLAGMGSMKGQNVTMKDLMNWNQTTAPQENGSTAVEQDFQKALAELQQQDTGKGSSGSWQAQPSWDGGESWDQGWGNSWGSSNSWSSNSSGKANAKGKGKGVPQAFKSGAFQQRRAGGDGRIEGLQLLTPRALPAQSMGIEAGPDSVWPEIEDPTRPKHIPMTSIALPSRPKVVEPPALSGTGMPNLEASHSTDAASSTFEALLG